MKTLIKFDFPSGSFQAEVSYQVIPDKKHIVTLHPNKSSYEDTLLGICAAYYTASEPWAEKLAGTITTDKEIFNKVFMTALNFGTLDYSSSDDFEYEVTWRYFSLQEIYPPTTCPSNEQKTQISPTTHP